MVGGARGGNYDLAYGPWNIPAWDPAGTRGGRADSRDPLGQN